MSESISGGIVTASKKRRVQMFEALKALLKLKGRPRRGRSARRKIAKRYRAICREQLCCLPSHEELRKRRRAKKKRRVLTGL